MADVAIIAIEADLGAARLLAQDLRAEGVDAEAMTPDQGQAALGEVAVLLFYATDAALTTPAWRGLAAHSSAARISAVAAVLGGEVNPGALAAVLPTDRTAPPELQAVLALLVDTLGEAVGADADAEEDLREEDRMAEVADEATLERAAPPPAPKAPPLSQEAPPAPPPEAPARPPRPAPARGIAGGVGFGRRKRAAPSSDAARSEATPGGAAKDEGAAGAIRQATLHENAPRKMRLGARREVVVRISAAKGADAGMSGEIRAHQIMAAQVMTVTLDDPDFAFAVRPLTPATQWIDRTAVARLGFVGAAATAEWRWSVEALKPGANRLAITASARVTDASGVSADAGLPPQIVTVRVSVAPGRIVIRAARWAAIAIGAAVLGHYSVAIMDAARRLFD